MNHAKDTSLRDMLDLVRTHLLSKHSYCNVILRIFLKKYSGIIWLHYIFSFEHFPIILCSFFNHIVPSEYTRSSRNNEKNKTVFVDIGLEPMKTVLLFFFLDDDDPVLQVGLELRDYESENGRKQSFSYDVSWTQLRSDIVLWFMFKHLKQYHRLQIWYICISLKTYFEKSSGGNYKCQKRRVLNMDYGQYAILSKDLTQLRYPERDTIVNNLIFKKKNQF